MFGVEGSKYQFNRSFLVNRTVRRYPLCAAAAGDSGLWTAEPCRTGPFGLGAVVRIFTAARLQPSAFPH